jgi:peptidoglycan hydrolase CwlO-like protein
MKSIRFSETELEFLKAHYELELEEAKKYIEDVKGILKKLGAELEQDVDEKPKKRRGRPPKKASEKKETEAKASETPAKKAPVKKKSTRKRKTTKKTTPKAVTPKMPEKIEVPVEKELPK